MCTRGSSHRVESTIHEIGAIAAMDMYINKPRTNKSAACIDSNVTIRNRKLSDIPDSYNPTVGADDRTLIQSIVRKNNGTIQEADVDDGHLPYPLIPT